MKENVICLIAIIYDLSEQNDFNNEKLNIKSLLRGFLIRTFKKKLNIKLIKAFIIETSNLLR